eukprot:SAG31_NODE_155_length_22130_cov_9.540098_26_plen_63_part_00
MLSTDDTQQLARLAERDAASRLRQVRGYFLVFVQLFEKYGTLIERYTALIEKVSPCIRLCAG